MRAIHVLFLMVVVGLAGLAAGVIAHPYLAKLGLPGLGDPDKKKPGFSSTDEVSALGRLEPESEIVKVSAPAGSRIDRLDDKVKEGAFVAKDAPLAYLDSYPELQAAHKLAQIQLDEAKERLKAETTLNQAIIAAAKLKVQHAEEVLPKQIDAQKAEVRRSQAELDKCKLDLDRSEKLLADKTIPQSQHDSALLLHRQCREQLDRNQATLEHLKADRDLKVLLAQADLTAAVAGLKKAELSTLVESLASAEKLAAVRMDRAIIKAPIEGEIIKIMTRAGEAVGRDPILKMGNTKSMYAIAEVYETDVRQLRPGMKATIASRAFPDDKLTGVVERISNLIHKNDVLNLDPAKDADTRVIEVRIRLDDSKIAARYNYMQVDVKIQPER